ncbi:MAG TPA: carbohydrate binding family 9 domain-containing protein, partial [Thermoanaerobaculia bacterium]|nr:carbohydrate binding family 9 domain-containing protein [Thermoanaerobaculia bacterium]
MKSILCGLLLVGSLSPAFLDAQTPQEERKPLAARKFEVRRATSAIKVDGTLDEPAWAAALVYDLPYEWAPGDNTPPPVKTDFLVTYDDDNLYVAWRAYDPDPSAIRAHLMDRDAIDTFVQDDHVVFMVDSFNDERRAFQFRVNPLGVQADAIFSENEGIEDFSFDMIWASAGRITAEGYVVEVAIPLNQIRFPRTSEPQTWGFDVGRSYPRSVRHRLAAYPRERGNTCLLCQVDKVGGFTGLEPGRNIELDPT